MKKSLVLLAVLLLTALLFESQAYLEVSTGAGTEREVRLREPLVPGQEFELRYTHSVHRTPVREVFRYEADDGLLLVSTAFRDYGAGIADAGEGETFRQGEEGFFWVEDLDRPSESFTVLLHPVPRQHLEFGNKSYDLLGLTDGETRVRLDLVHAPRAGFW